jgi:Ribonuclease G/E
LSSKKAVSTASIIEGADGPTSVFVVKGGKHRTTVKQKIYKLRFHIRKAREEQRIKANPHSMEEVENYIKDFLGFTEVKQNTDKYQTEYSEMRASFLLQYAPGLLGELDSFDINLHIFEKNDADTQMQFSIERNYGYIGGGASGSKKNMKKYEKLYRDIYRYYGVSQEDIDHKTARYEMVIKTLAGR